MYIRPGITFTFLKLINNVLFFLALIMVKLPKLTYTFVSNTVRCVMKCLYEYPLTESAYKQSWKKKIMSKYKR